MFWSFKLLIFWLGYCLGFIFQKFALENTSLSVLSVSNKRGCFYTDRHIILERSWLCTSNLAAAVERRLDSSAKKKQQMWNNHASKILKDL
jgi:hypothetical protein